VIIQHQDGRLLVKAPAKINLHLEVLGKRPDGYHELETLMVAVDRYDELLFEKRPDGVELVCSQPGLSMGDDNLVTKALELVRRETGLTTGISIALTKRIPMAAGLAGGSSDAAATLAGLNAWWNLGWNPTRLAHLSAKLGSDVPFFFATPAAVCRGRGELTTPCRIGKPLHLAVVKPNEGLSTAAVFGRLRLDETKSSVEPIVEALEAGDATRIGSLLFNRLEEPAFAMNSKVAELRRLLDRESRLGSLMTGSGSAVYALCESRNEAEELARRLSAMSLGDVFAASSCE
jgi:4-diphosphocytidyl-2-C-methyl-D-erythritol kinase